MPERFELGTLPYELLAGTTAAVDFLAGMTPLVHSIDQSGERARRARLRVSMSAIAGHEDRLRTRLEDGLRAIGDVTIWSRASRRTPTVLFSVSGHASADVYRRLAARGVNAPAGSFYAIEASRRLGLGDTGAVRAGIAPYTSDADVDRLLAGVADLVGRRA